MRTRVKICGITSIEDAQAAVAAGTDAIGLVFAENSPRCVTLEQAQAIARSMPPFVTIVGLFVDAPAERVREVLTRVVLDLLQFHGSESPEQCRLYNLPYVKAVPMQQDVDVHAMEARYGDAAGLVLDAYNAGTSGGTGLTFDWMRIPNNLNKPVILAGGLTPDNVAEAIAKVHPYAVDVASGVEQSKGVKDLQKIQAFIDAVGEAV